jgi:3-oxoacyl-[acyl-carrier-protein] synthase III
MIGVANGTPISITGLGCHVPERIVTNDELASLVDTSDEWIVERTGIRERRIAGDEEALSDLALPAARRALEMAGLDASTVDLLVVATVTPDMAFPSAAALLADALGMPDAAAYDLSAGCTGFVYAIAQAQAMLAAGLSQRALVVGGDVLSKILDWRDRSATARARSCSSASRPRDSSASSSAPTAAAARASGCREVDRAGSTIRSGT